MIDDASWTPRQQELLDQLTDRLVADIYFEFDLLAEREAFAAGLVIDPREIDRTIGLILTLG